MTTTTTTTERERPARFTDDWLRKFKLQPGKAEEIVFEKDRTGLGIRATSRGNISFILQLRLGDGRRWNETLGSWGKLTVVAARRAAQAKAGDIAKGVDLFERRRKIAAKLKAEAEAAEASKLTLGVIFERWKKQHLNAKRPAYAERAWGNVERNFQHLFGVPAASLTTKEVRAVLDKMRDKMKGKRRARGGPAAMRNAAVSLKALYAWALDEEIIEENALRDLKLPEQGDARARTLSADEVRRVWAASFRFDYPAGPFIRLLMLTGCRRAEIAALRWDEIVNEEDGKAVVLQGERTKTGAGHHVPLSQAALDVIAGCERNRIVGSKFVLTSDGRRHFANFGRVKAWLDEALADDGAPIPAWTLHDFRRTIVSTLARKPFRFNPVVLDKLLGHQPTTLTPVARIYAQEEHADQRRDALAAWGRFLTQTPAELVDLARKRG
jgi:integrase